MKTSREYRTLSRESLRGKWRPMCLLMLLAGLFANKFGLDAILDTYFSVEKTVLGRAFLFPMGFGWPLSAAVLAMSAVGGICTIGRYAVSKDVLAGKTPQLCRLFPLKLFWKTLAMNIVRSVLLGLQTLLLIVPGLIAWYRYSMADYILAENPDMGPIQALKESRLRIKGRKWDLLCLDFSFIGWVLLAYVPIFLMKKLPGLDWHFMRIACTLLLFCGLHAYSYVARTAFFEDVLQDK